MDKASTIERLTRSGGRGQVLPLVALALTFLFGAATLAIDVGYLRFKQRVQQSATDSAAIAGANELTYIPSTRVFTGAKMDAALNGYTDGSAKVTVTVYNPPKSGPYTGVATAVEVIIQNTEPVFFWGIFGVNNLPISTRAVAALAPARQGCVYALKGDITLNGGGGGGINAPTCGIETNGNLNVTGQANVDARFIGYLGNGPGGGTYPEGQPTLLTIPIADPCYNKNEFPNCAALASQDVSQVPCVDGGTLNMNALPPGRYCNANTFRGVITSITLAPTANNALYVFDKVFPTMSMSGPGATIYNNTGKGVTWNGNINVKVTAPTSGPTSGIAYFQPASNSGAIIKNGQAGVVDFEGAFYAPTAPVTMNGNLPSVSLFVAGSIRMNGSGMNVASSPGLVQVGFAVLAE